MKRLLLVILILLGGIGAANAQCAGGLVPNCPVAVNPQPTDVVLLWQYAQKPNQRKLPLSVLAAGGLVVPTAPLLSGNGTSLGGVTAITGVPISGSPGSFTTLSASGTVSGAGFTTLLSPYLTTSLAASTYAPKASPAFTGTPTAPTVAATAAAGTTQLATTAFVRNGTTTNDSALTGQIGQYVSSTIASGSAVSATTATPINVTSISLTAGDWEVTGTVADLPAVSTVASILIGAISTATGSLGTSPAAGGYASFPVQRPAGFALTMPVGVTRLSLASTTTVYLVAQASFTVSTDAVYGFIGARRVR